MSPIFQRKKPRHRGEAKVTWAASGSSPFQGQEESIMLGTGLGWVSP